MKYIRKGILIALVLVLLPGTSEESGNKELLFNDFVVSFYERIGDTDLDYDAFRIGLRGYMRLRAEGRLRKPSLLTIIDYSKSSNAERFFLFNVDEQVLLRKTLVAHGKNTGQEYARYFSNVPETKKSSMGFHITAESYYGMHGLSLRIDGLEPLFNGNVRKRDIVMHSAEYVSEEFIAENQRLGRSWGCPALPVENYVPVILRIKNGSCLFVYYPDEKYLSTSKYANEATPLELFPLKGVISS